VRKFPSLQAYPLSGGQDNQIRTTEGPTSDLRRVYEMGSNLDFWTGGNSQQLSNILRLTRSRSGKSSGGTKRRIERATRAVRAIRPRTVLAPRGWHHR
jgi:hypothetical protein